MEVLLINGRAQLLVQTTGDTGPVVVSCTSDGLKSVPCTLTSTR